MFNLPQSGPPIGSFSYCNVSTLKQNKTRKTGLYRAKGFSCISIGLQIRFLFFFFSKDVNPWPQYSLVVHSGYLQSLWLRERQRSGTSTNLWIIWEGFVWNESWQSEWAQAETNALARSLLGLSSHREGGWDNQISFFSLFHLSSTTPSSVGVLPEKENEKENWTPLYVKSLNGLKIFKKKTFPLFHLKNRFLPVESCLSK